MRLRIKTLNGERVNIKQFNKPEELASYLSGLNEYQRVVYLNKPSGGAAMGSGMPQIFGETIAEEYIDGLRGYQAAIIWDKMQRSDYQVAYIMQAVLGTIKSANYEFEGDMAVNGTDKMIEACEWFWRSGMGKTANENLNDILSYLPNGYCVLEPVEWVPVDGIPHVGKGWALKSLGYRPQRTIWGWLFNEDGSLKDIHQISYSNNYKLIDVKIPAENCTVLTFNRLGDNYEGRSMLRPAYGPWLRKQLYAKLMAIGLEKSALGMIIVTVPPNKVGTPEETAFLEAVQNYVAHENGYLKKISSLIGDSGGFNIEIVELNFKGAEITDAIAREDAAISKCVAAQFSEVAQGGNGGAYNAITGMIDFFLNTWDMEARYISEKLQPLFNKFCLYNFGAKPAYPRLKITGINDAFGENLTRAINGAKLAGIYTPQKEDEKLIRAKLKLPAMNAETESSWDNPAPLPPMFGGDEPAEDKEEDAPEPDDNDDNKEDVAVEGEETELSKQSGGYVSKIKAGVDYKAFVKEGEQLMDKYNTDVRSVLTYVKDGLIRDIERAYKNNPNNVMGEIKKIDMPSGKQLKDYIIADLTRAMTTGKKQGEVILDKKKRRNKHRYSLKFTPANRRWLNNTADVTTTLMLDSVFKKLMTSAQTAADKELSPEQAIFDIGNEVEGYINNDNNLGGGALMPKALDQGRDETYYENGVSITGWLYLNYDPITEICNWLNNRTAKEGDPDAVEYAPPNHWNCKSFKVPIMSDEPQPDIWDGWAVPGSVLAAQETLSCRCNEAMPEHIKELLNKIKEINK